MKKSWMFLLLAPVISLSAAFPIYDEEYDAHNELQMDAHEEEMVSEQLSEDGDAVASDNEAQEEEASELSKRRYKRQSSKDLSLEQNTPNASKLKRTPAKKNNRSSIKRSTAARTKMKDARQNSDRPRVTHRGQEQKGPQNVEQVEADASTEENGKQYAPKVRKSPAVAEKKTGQVQRRPSSSTSKKGVKAKPYHKGTKKAEAKSKSHHFGKRPLNE